MEETRLILVDELDNEKGVRTKSEAHISGALHRAVSVFIVNHEGKWLLQQRALSKYHSAGLWTNTCCSHPFPGESVQKAATRRLMEEMGIQTEITPLFSFTYKEILENGLTEHEFDHVFLGYYDSLPLINPDEVMNYRYLSFDAIKAEIESNPGNYTVWFRKIFEQVNEHILNRLQ